MTSSTKHLRAGLTERSFRRYEPLIQSILKKWPGISVFDPNAIGLSIETVSARLRDSIRSLYENNWATSWDHSRIADVYPAVTTAMHEGLVIVGPRDKVQAHKAEPVADPERASKVDFLHVSGPSMEFLRAYALLASFHLDGLPKLEAACVEQAFIDTLLESDEYDIAIVKEENKVLIF